MSPLLLFNLYTADLENYMEKTANWRYRKIGIGMDMGEAYTDDISFLVANNKEVIIDRNEEAIGDVIGKEKMLVGNERGKRR